VLKRQAFLSDLILRENSLIFESNDYRKSRNTSFMISCLRKSKQLVIRRTRNRGADHMLNNPERTTIDLWCTKIVSLTLSIIDAYSTAERHLLSLLLSFRPHERTSVKKKENTDRSRRTSPLTPKAIFICMNWHKRYSNWIPWTGNDSEIQFGAIQNYIKF
jgi:hypothetical protein